MYLQKWTYEIIARKRYGANLIAFGDKYTTSNLANKMTKSFFSNPKKSEKKKLMKLGFAFDKKKFDSLGVNKSLLPKELK